MSMVRMGAVALILAASAACGRGDAGFTTRPPDEDFMDGIAVIELSFESWTFEGAEPGIGDTEVLVISSLGDTDLLVDAYMEDNDDLVFFFLHDDETEATIPPGEEHELTLAVLLDSAEPATAAVRLETNDPERPTIRVALDVVPK
jgi:hypothetical protein